MAQVPRQALGIGFISGAIQSVIRGVGDGGRAAADGPADVAARIAHELAHAGQMAQHGQANPPDMRESGSDAHKGETTTALGAESAVADELGTQSNLELTQQEQMELLGFSVSWDSFTDEQRQQCLSDLACLYLSQGQSTPSPR